MRRRDFITLLGGAAVAWPVAARAQQGERMCRIGVLMPFAEGDPEGLVRSVALQQGLEKLGWTIGRNVQIDYHWGIRDVEKAQAAIRELLALAPDVIIASTSQTVAALQQTTVTVPIVFTGTYEPVAQGFVRSLAHPGGNITGFTNVEATIGAKWLGAAQGDCTACDAGRIHVRSKQSWAYANLSFGGSCCPKSCDEFGHGAG